MKICKIYIKGYQQFQDVELDFMHPETGNSLDKICFIGSNGTGKSKILLLLKDLFEKIMPGVLLEQPMANYRNFFSSNPNARILFKILFEKRIYFFCYSNTPFKLFFRGEDDPEKNELLARKILLLDDFIETRSTEWQKYTEGTLASDFLHNFLFKLNDGDLLVYSPAEGTINNYSKITDVPITNVNEALELFKHYPAFVEVSQDTLNNFWKLLVYNLRKRAEERDEYENRPENISKTKQKLIEEFDQIHPKVLEHLSLVWDKILSKAGLYFDAQGASNPYQLNDNLKAYIKLKTNDQTIPYAELSTGIRNFIFRLGHIFSLYFNRDIDRAFLLIDEPENSLYPDFLFDLVETYNEVIIDKRGQNNTQMFFATHNPIIAAQFQPYERIILDWNEDGSVSARKGVSPVGDDPNDVLTYDFALTELMGPEGRKMWEKYVCLKKKLIREKDDEKKDELIHEINQIGSLYNFG